MYRYLIGVVSVGIGAFFAGKYAYEEQERKRLAYSEVSSKYRNSFSSNTVAPPFRLIQYPYFNILYSTYHKSPLAVHQFFNKQINIGTAPRSKLFFPDQNIKEKHFQVDQSFYYETEAYKRFNVNRGHMAAAGNYSGIQSQKFHTFTFSNIIPQNGYNNQGIWRTFESYTRRLALNQKCDSIEVISGPIYVQIQSDKSKKNEHKLIVLKQNGIPIPQKLYKIIKCNSQQKSYFNAFQFYNSQTFDNDNTLEYYKVPLSRVEQQTGLKFLIQGGQLSEVDENGLKSKKKDLDYQFYVKLITKGNTISQMNQSFRSAKEQKIQISLQQFTDKIRQFAANELTAIENEKILECQRLQKYMKLNKHIFYLYHLDKTKDLRVDRMKDTYNKCLVKKDESQQQKVVYNNLTSQLGNDILRFIQK